MISNYRQKFLDLPGCAVRPAAGRREGVKGTVARTLAAAVLLKNPAPVHAGASAAYCLGLPLA